MQSNVRHYTFFGLFVIAIGFGIMLLWPFLTVLILSAALASVCYPVYKWLLRKLTRGNKWFAAILTIIAFIIVICGPIAFIGVSVYHQVQDIYISLTQNGGATGLVDRINAIAARYLPWATFDVSDRAVEVAGAVTSRLGSIVGVVFSTILSFLLMILTMFYFLKDGGQWRRSVIQASPLSESSTNQILSKLALAVDGVVKGYLLIALVQGIMMGIGLWIFGVPHPALWGLLAGIASLIPTIGTALVSVPAIIFLVSIGSVGAAVGLGLWALVLVGTVDNLLSPIIVGRKIDIHPMFILFAILGGLALMGPAGILIGPLGVSFIYALTAVYSSEMKS